MSDNAPDTPAVETPAESGAPAQEKDWKAEAEKIKAEARKWEARAKENSKAADRLAEIEEASKTADQRAADRLAAAEKRAAELEAKALRAEVAAEKGVPVALLNGATREDLEAAADALIAFRGEQKPADKASFVIPSEGGAPAAALNGDPLLDSLKSKLGIA